MSYQDALKTLSYCVQNVCDGLKTFSGRFISVLIIFVGVLDVYNSFWKLCKNFSKMFYRRYHVPRRLLGWVSKTFTLRNIRCISLMQDVTLTFERLKTQRFDGVLWMGFVYPDFLCRLEDVKTIPRCLAQAHRTLDSRSLVRNTFSVP